MADMLLSGRDCGCSSRYGGLQINGGVDLCAKSLCRRHSGD